MRGSRCGRSGKTWAAAETFCQWKVKPTNQIGCGPTLVLCHCTSAGGPHTPRGKAITSVRRHPAIVKIPPTAAAPALISSAGSQCLQLVLWSSTVFIWSSFDFSAQRYKLNILARTYNVSDWGVGEMEEFDCRVENLSRPDCRCIFSFFIIHSFEHLA